jgi:uncharacterized protein YbbK (DUF523 family)
VRRVLVSACLLGEEVRHDGGGARCADPVLLRWLAEGRVVPLCPEVAGGLPVPRPPAELSGGDGGEALAGRARVLTAAGEDLTSAFLAGARAAAEACRERGVALAVLKDRSPSCGTATVHDGSFAGRLVPGQGVTAAALRRAGVRVFSEAQWAEAEACLREIEGA